MHAIFAGPSNRFWRRSPRIPQPRTPISCHIARADDFPTLHTKPQTQIAATSAPALAQVYENRATEHRDTGKIDELYKEVEKDIELADSLSLIHI